jgi:hypothetical protein
LRNIHNLEKLHQSILKQVFEDKLFSKDLYDGTGEELLKKLKAEKGNCK